MCDCDFRTNLVGDGCAECNPNLYIDYLKEQLEELTIEMPKINEEESISEYKSKTIENHREIIRVMAEIIKVQDTIIDRM